MILQDYGGPGRRAPSVHWTGARRGPLALGSQAWTDSRHWAAGYRQLSVHGEGMEQSLHGATGIIGGWHRSRHGGE